MKKYIHKELAIVVVLTVIAFILRALFLDKVPLGIHGDEGWTGIEAKRIISEGFIQMYSPSALGQPIGPAWVTSVFFRLFGSNIISLRLSMSLFGVLTVPLFYLTIRKLFSINVSTIISLFFSFALFHIHYSRMGFMLISAPLFAIGTLFFFFTFIKTPQYRTLICAAILCGIGMYSYNTFVLFPPTIAIALIYLWRKKTISFFHIIIFGLVFTASASLLIHQLVQDPASYFFHHKTASIINQDEFTHAKNLSSKVAYIGENSSKKITHFIIGGLQDGGDGFGANQSIDWVILLLATGGMILIVKHKNKLFIWLFFSFLLQLVPLVTTVDGYYRREIIGYMYLYIFAGYFLQQLYHYVPKTKAHYLTIGISIVLIAQCGLNVWQYFVLFPKYYLTQFVYAPEVYLAITQVHNESKDTAIILYSKRFDCNYETFQFLLSDTICIDYDPEGSTNITLDNQPYINLYIDAYINQGLDIETGRRTLLKLDEKTIGVIEWIDLHKPLT